MQVGLIGRERELDELRALVTQSPVVLVYGAAGIGKTTVVLAALEELARAEVIPPVAHVSLEGVTEPREALERTARAMGVARPPLPSGDDDGLVELLGASPRAVVWDDVEVGARALAPLVARFQRRAASTSTRDLEEEIAPSSRVVLVTRRFISAKEVGMRTPVLSLGRLGHEDALGLIRALEAARGRTLADDLVDVAGGNPLLIQLALADDPPSSAPGGATEALRRVVAERAGGAAGGVLSLLASSGAPLDEAEVAKALGKAARDAIDELRKHLVIVREGGRISLAPHAAPLVRDVVGEPRAETWQKLQRVADRMLSASAQDDRAVIAAARARIELGDASEALALLRAHPLARAAADPSALERVLRAVAAASSKDRFEALMLLAREQLRSGDYDSARRTLDDLPRTKDHALLEKTALLRAECHVRAGEPAAAQRAIDSLLKKGDSREKPSVALALTQAQLAILRGELEQARTTLTRLAKATSGIPTLEARRAVQIAATYLYEERHDLSHEWVGRARAAQRAAGVPVEPVVTIVDVHALLGLGLVDRAEEMIAREAEGRAHAPMLELAALVRRGELARAAAAGDAALATVDRRADLLFRSVVARDLTRAYLGLGDLSRAAKMLRIAETGADEPGLAVLRPICDSEHARLADARGDRARARERIERAWSKMPASPFAIVDREVMHDREPPALGDAPPVARAYAQLRASEAAVARGDLQRAVAEAEAAARYYGEAGLAHEAARAQLVLAEALVRSGTSAADDAALARAELAIDVCLALGGPRGLVPIVVGAWLVRATLSESRGDLEGASTALESALRAAGKATDATLTAAARRAGIVAPREGTGRASWSGLVDRLGLLTRAEIVWRVGRRAWLLREGEAPPEPAVCTVDVEARRVRVDGGKSVSMPEQRIALLATLADAGDEGVTLEEIFARVWNAPFHPLRHRNAIYVALARLKDSLKPLETELRIAHDGDRYRLAGASVAVRRTVGRGERASARDSA